MLTANMKMNTRIKTSLLILAVAVLASCSKGKGGTPYDGVPLIILDTDLVSSTDDLFAMEMLYRYEEEGKCKFLGIVVDREGEAGAAVADVMNTYFNHADTPIGLVRKGIPSPRVWIDYSSLPSLADERGEKLFRRSVKDCPALPDGWELYRRLLASAPDNSVTICSIGFVTSLAQLLESGPDGYSPLSGAPQRRGPGSQEGPEDSTDGRRFRGFRGTGFQLCPGPLFRADFLPALAAGCRYRFYAHGSGRPCRIYP